MKGTILFRAFSASTRTLLRTKPIQSARSVVIARYANPTTPARFYSSDSSSKSTPSQVDTQRSNIPTIEGVEVVSDEELKRMIERFYNSGDGDMIPSLFEAILARKLAGVGDDDSLMKELREKFPGEIPGMEDFDSEDDDDVDDEDDDVDDEDDD
ncbi:hypothetical protein LINGRAHAP2_LOCUS11613 [Linum grandiflorum]